MRRGIIVEVGVGIRKIRKKGKEDKIEMIN
jgi:hypothetical protein